MIALRGTKHYEWRSLYAERPVQVVEIDLTGSAGWNGAGLADELVDALETAFPGLGGDVRRFDAAALTAALALKIQSTHDLVPQVCGVHSRSPDAMQAVIFFACMDPYLGNVTGRLATQLVDTLATERALSRQMLMARLGRIEELVYEAGLDRSTRAMAAAATRRGIPWFRIAPSRYLQMGQGRAQRHVIETLRSGESGTALELSANKLLTFLILNAIQLPVGRFAAVGDANSAIRAAETIGYPIVLKPAVGMKGESVFAGLRNAEELRAALTKVAGQRRQFLLQSMLPGDDHRLLVVSGRLIAAARRIPASVTGDGKRSVAQLVKEANKDRRRGRGRRKIMNLIEIDAEVARLLSHQGLTLESVPAEGTPVRLRATANISTGGTAVGVTENVHPDNAEAAITAAKALGLTVAGIDFISPDISRSWREVGGGICEVNSVVALTPHWLGNPECDAAGAILETIYPPGETGRIPTAMITGTKGKSTTSLMLSSILSCAGHTVGAATTDGVIVADKMIARGDLAAALGAEMVIRHPAVTAAVLETARGGLILRGIYLEHCDVAALLNVGREQIEMDGVDSVDDMARLKRRVLETARRAIVLNADDARCAAMARDFPSVRKILFSMRPELSAIRRHVGTGDAVIFVKTTEAGEVIALSAGGEETVLLPVAELPSALGGVVRHNIANAMAAAGLALGLGMTLESVAAGLRRYENSMGRARGRFSFAEGFPMRILFDRATEAPGLEPMMVAIGKIPVSGRRICAMTAPGNRPGWYFDEAAKAIVGNFDLYVCFERADYLRGKRPGEIAERLSEALVAAGVSGERVKTARSNREAAEIIAKNVDPDDLVVVFGSDVTTSVQEYREAFDRFHAPVQSN